MPMLHDDTAAQEGEAVMNIPPHIAARFYRSKKPGRRRSSSSSSTTPSIIHAADRAHSRRTSFLESRRSRLAARALHAERVRTKVNHDSHRIGTDRMQALQKSLGAAQEARDALLAKTAAACAGEVAKAKAVAEEVRSRREEELACLKNGMKERLKLAEERRLELLKSRTQRRARGSSASRKPATEIDDIVTPLRKSARQEEKEEDDAARKLQRFWRTQRNRLVVKKFNELGITIDSVKAKSFDDASVLVMNPELLNATADLLRLCGLLDDNVDAAAVKTSCRTFISAYLILGHPAEVLSNDGENEKALMTQSKDLLCAFECWLSTASAHNSYLGAPHLRKNLVEAYQPFAIAFTAWKERDQAELLNTMIAQFVELDLLWQKVKAGSEAHVAQEYHEGIKENQMLILSKLKKLGGQRAVLNLKKAVSKARRTRLKKKEDSKPRAVQDQAEPGSPLSPISPVSPAHEKLSRFIEEAKEERHQDDDQDETTGYQVDDDSKFMLSNRQIAHELLLNRDFQLQPREKPPIEKMVEQQAKRAFYDIMQEDIANGNSERWIPMMAETVRQKLLRLVPPASSLHQLVSNVIDIELISQQCCANVYDYASFFKFVYSLLPSICSPARDEAVKNLATESTENDNYITRLEKLFEVLELMQMDHANYLLTVSAPHIIPEAIPYERRMFAQQLEGKEDGLKRVGEWLKVASDEKAAEAQSRDPEGVNHPRARPTPVGIYNHAFANLVITLEDLDPASIPETFELDLERLYNYRRDVRTTVFSSAMLLTVKSLLRRDARTSWKSLKEEIVGLLSQSMTPEAKSKKVLDLMADSANIPSPNEQQSAHIVSALTRLFDPATAVSDPVVKVMMNRLRQFVLARLNAQTPKEKVRLAAGAGETLTSFGMAEQVSEIGTLVDSLVRLAGINQAIYSQWYDGFLATDA